MINSIVRELLPSGHKLGNYTSTQLCFQELRNLSSCSLHFHIPFTSELLPLARLRSCGCLALVLGQGVINTLVSYHRDKARIGWSSVTLSFLSLAWGLLTDVQSCLGILKKQDFPLVGKLWRIPSCKFFARTWSSRIVSGRYILIVIDTFFGSEQSASARFFHSINDLLADFLLFHVNWKSAV